MLLPCRKIRLLVVAGFFCLAQKIAGDGFHLACIAIEKRQRLIELHLQCVDDVSQANSRGHSVKAIILGWAPASLDNYPPAVYSQLM